MAKVVAVITSYNRADFIEKCIRSVLDSSNEKIDAHVLVMDNGSDDASPKLAAAMGEKVRVERSIVNRPLTGVINKALKIALVEMEADYVIVMNDDTQFTQGSLAKLYEVSEEHPNALIAPLQLNYRDPELVDPMALELAQRSSDILEDALMQRELRTAYPVRTIIGAGMFAKRHVWERLGYWDELYQWYGPDDDYCNRALYHGYEVLLVPHSYLLHAHGQLNADIQKLDHSGAWRRWRLQTQMRYMALLKDPRQSFPRCLLWFTSRFIADQLRYMLGLWGKGMFLSADAFLHCIVRIPRVIRARKEQMDPSRRAPA